MEILFKSNRKGQPRAYYFSRPCFRWMPIGVEAAKLAIAIGEATEVGTKRFPTASERKAEQIGAAIYDEIIND